MAAIKFDIPIEQGATFEMTLTYADSVGVPINLTGYSAEMQVREEVGGRVLATASTSNGSIVLSSGGQVVITLAAAQTSLIGAIVGVYDLFLKSPAGNPIRKLVYGNVTVKQSVTRQ